MMESLQFKADREELMRLKAVVQKLSLHPEPEKVTDAMFTVQPLSSPICASCNNEVPELKGTRTEHTSWYNFPKNNEFRKTH